MTIVLAVGLPGSGKSTYFARLGAHAISSDAIRLQLADDETVQTIHERVFATARYLLRQRLDLERPITYIDATHLTAAERLPYVQIARERGCRIEAIYFDVPPDVCKARNAARGRVVPDAAIDLMAEKITRPSETEGFDRIQIVTA